MGTSCQTSVQRVSRRAETDDEPASTACAGISAPATNSTAAVLSVWSTAVLATAAGRESWGPSAAASRLFTAYVVDQDHFPNSQRDFQYRAHRVERCGGCEVQ